MKKLIIITVILITLGTCVSLGFKTKSGANQSYEEAQLSEVPKQAKKINHWRKATYPSRVYDFEIDEKSFLIWKDKMLKRYMTTLQRRGSIMKSQMVLNIIGPMVEIKIKPLRMIVTYKEPTSMMHPDKKQNPDALIFTGAESSTLRTHICGACGFAELYASDPGLLWAAYVESEKK